MAGRRRAGSETRGPVGLRAAAAVDADAAGGIDAGPSTRLAAIAQIALHPLPSGAARDHARGHSVVGRPLRHDPATGPVGSRRRDGARRAEGRGDHDRGHGGYWLGHAGEVTGGTGATRRSRIAFPTVEPSRNIVRAGDLTITYRERARDRPCCCSTDGRPPPPLANVMPAIAVARRVIALDLSRVRGVGEAARRPLRFALFKRAIGDFLDTLEVEEVGLAVHDLGGPIGVHWALSRPERVSGSRCSTRWCTRALGRGRRVRQVS